MYCNTYIVWILFKSDESTSLNKTGSADLSFLGLCFESWLWQHREMRYSDKYMYIRTSRHAIRQRKHRNCLRSDPIRSDHRIREKGSGGWEIFRPRRRRQERRMPRGNLELLLVSARGLKSADFFCKTYLFHLHIFRLSRFFFPMIVIAFLFILCNKPMVFSSYLHHDWFLQPSRIRMSS